MCSLSCCYQDILFLRAVLSRKKGRPVRVLIHMCSFSSYQDILFLRAVLSRKKGRSSEDTVGLLNEASQTHFGSLKGLPLGPKYFTQMNPDFLMEMVKEYLIFAPTQVSILMYVYMQYSKDPGRVGDRVSLLTLAEWMAGFLDLE